MTRRSEVTKALRRAATLSATLLLSGLCSTARAQVTTQCPSTTYTSSGTEMHLHLNSHWDPTTNKCEPNDPAQPPGTNGVQSCYDSEEVDSEGHRMSELTECAPCQIGVQAGCFYTVPPPDHFNIELLPPFNPFEPYEPPREPYGGGGIKPGEIMPDEPPPMMDFYVPWRWL